MQVIELLVSDKPVFNYLWTVLHTFYEHTLYVK